MAVGSSSMTELSDRPLRELLAEVGAATPAPGGGCSLAWTCALAGSLVEMAAAIALARDERGLDPQAQRLEYLVARARAIRAQALAIGEDELHAYAPVLAAQRRPSTDRDRRARVAAALAQAATGPVALAGIAAELTTLGSETAAQAGAHVAGDALAGCLLAEAVCQGAAQLARINLAGAPEDERLGELLALTEQASRTRSQALSGARS